MLNSVEPKNFMLESCPKGEALDVTTVRHLPIFRDRE
jgi:hypothetical protein